MFQIQGFPLINWRICAVITGEVHASFLHEKKLRIYAIIIPYGKFTLYSQARWWLCAAIIWLIRALFINQLTKICAGIIALVRPIICAWYCLKEYYMNGLFFVKFFLFRCNIHIGKSPCRVAGSCKGKNLWMTDLLLGSSHGIQLLKCFFFSQNNSTPPPNHQFLCLLFIWCSKLRRTDFLSNVLEFFLS